MESKLKPRFSKTKSFVPSTESNTKPAICCLNTWWIITLSVGAMIEKKDNVLNTSK
jgi:hypothetical protein